MNLVKLYRDALQEIVDGYRFGRYPDSITFAEKTLEDTKDVMDDCEETLRQILSLKPASDLNETECLNIIQNLVYDTLEKLK